MKKRIVAWLLLIGFLFLIFNIMVLKFYQMISFAIYIIIAGYFLLVINKKKK